MRKKKNHKVFVPRSSREAQSSSHHSPPINSISPFSLQSWRTPRYATPHFIHLEYSDLESKVLTLLFMMGKKQKLYWDRKKKVNESLNILTSPLVKPKAMTKEIWKHSVFKCMHSFKKNLVKFLSLYRNKNIHTVYFSSLDTLCTIFIVVLTYSKVCFCCGRSIFSLQIN